jgi:hypothetical protein
MSLNPLIKLGELHNEILDYVISQSPTNPPEITQMANIISDYYAANYAPTNNLTEKNKCYSLLMNYYNEFYGLTKSQLIAIANSRNGANPFTRKFIDNVFIDYSGYNLDSLIIYLNGLLGDTSMGGIWTSASGVIYISITVYMIKYINLTYIITPFLLSSSCMYNFFLYFTRLLHI